MTFKSKLFKNLILIITRDCFISYLTKDGQIFKKLVRRHSLLLSERALTS